ncbi:non-homologous end-joining DNA ligase [Janibacter cremeus]|uniref:non-homologous end-joining DNA ligase n=1 Tax=Janibacter cremeus TaxID=1285192 RepID=UPI0023F6716F|nr:non-homologous end-joining DNA ligase [Janibacter cremeus]WEV76723.1 non-homologous end-joining DNA ligase [Janibacter cremeus]
MRPMLATLTDTVPQGAEWVHEVKWDGMRVIVEAKGGTLTVTSRTGRDVTVAYPELAPLAELYDDMVLDGELVALVDGRPSFAGLTERMHVTNARRAATLAGSRPVTLMAFDLLRLLGQDLTAQPWSARRQLLEQLDIDGPRWQVPPTHDDGRGLLAATAEQGLEGIVSKRRSAPYAAGRRSPDWRKRPHRDSESVVVGGWRRETGGTLLGSVLVGVPGPEGWDFVGRVGAGLAGRAGAAVLERLRPLERGGSPFASEVPREDVKGTTWVEPEVVIDVASLGRGSGRLRQPSYLRTRTDLTAADLWETTDG